MRPKTKKMNRYRIMTLVLVISNIIMLVAMFIAAFWGFTYPRIVVDGYESGKSAFVAAFMCCLAGICLCGLNFQNYYLLVTYAILHILFMLNQLFSLLPFTWTRIPNYPLVGNVSTQVYVMLVPKLLLVAFAFALAYKLRCDEKRYELARTGGLHQRLPCHIVPRSGGPEPPPGAGGGGGGGGLPPGRCAPGTTPGGGGGPPPPPPISGGTGANAGTGTGPPPPPGTPAPAPNTSSVSNQIIQTPPIYPLHRPSVTDVSITAINHQSSNRPPPLVPLSNAVAPMTMPICHRPIPIVPPPPPPTNPNCPSRMGNHSTSCGMLNDIQHAMMAEPDHLRSLSSQQQQHLQWQTTTHHPVRSSATSPYPSAAQPPPPMTPTKPWWPNNTGAKQQQYSPYYRDVYNPNF